MRCSCPKCNTQVQVELSQTTEEGTVTPCPECNKRFWVLKESFARRILKKEGEIYCVKCGNELGSSVVCTGCGAMFPDYHAVLTAKPARRQIEKTGFSISFSSRQAKQSYTVHKTTVSSSKSSLVKVGLVVLAAALLVGMGVFYQGMKAEQRYAANFARALYAIKTGAELSINTSATIATEWKAKTDAGQGYSPHVSGEDESRLNTVNKELDNIMQKLNKPPRKFDKTNEKLASLYTAYATLRALSLAPSGSLASFTTATGKAESNYRQAVQEIKTGLPAELSTELENAKKKYKGLRDF